MTFLPSVGCRLSRTDIKSLFQWRRKHPIFCMSRRQISVIASVNFYQMSTFLFYTTVSCLPFEFGQRNVSLHDSHMG